MKEFKLSELAPFGVCTVAGTDECEAQKRLIDLGITEGTELVRLFSAPSGDPVAYAVRGAVIALRRSDAEHVSVRETEPWA